MKYCSEIHTCRDLAGKESMAKGDDLIDEAFLSVSEKKYPDGVSATRKRIIRKKGENFARHVCVKYF